MADGDGLCVLVIGGGGVFGSRLVTLLLETTGFTVIVAGRSPGRLAAHGRQGDAAARVTTRRLDTRTVTPAQLTATGAFAVVDAAGPYQDSDDRLVRAAMDAGMHYIDLADGRDFVAGFARLDAAAKAAGVIAVSGASSTPALSNAVLDALTAGWTRIDRIEVAISPGNRAPRGLSVVRSILGYAGRPVRVFVNGGWEARPGWGMTVRRDMPGIGRRFLSLSETPDLDILPARFRVRQAAVFRAGLELSFLHLGLWLVSLPVRARLLPALTPFARGMRVLASLFERLGSDRGGMTVDAFGLDAAGHGVSGHWSLVAEAGDGPFVPTLPALAMLRALAGGSVPAPGASACVGILSLSAIAAEFRHRRIAAASRIVAAPPSLYQRVLGAGFQDLPAPIRRLHQPGWHMRSQGIAQVDGAEGWLARLVAFLFRLPRPATDVPVTVDVHADADSERWRRDFGGARFASTLSQGRGPGRLVERFGPFHFELDLLADVAGVRGMPVRSWRIGPMPMPLLLAPGSVATEHVDAAGRFCFDVTLHLPLRLGRLVRYRGWLIPALS